MSNLTANEVREITIDHYIKLISFTILTHEYCFTFRLEVERFWTRNKATWIAAFFFLNRYLALLGYVPVMFQNFWYSSAHNKQTICRGLQSYHEYHAVAIQVVIAVMLIMRTHALYDRSRRVLALTIGAMLAAAIVACWSIMSGKAAGKQESKEYFFVIGCPFPHSQEEDARLAIAWGGLLAFDTLVFTLTVYKSLSLRRESGSSLLSLMLRDGSVYYGVMVASNVANILTYLYCGIFTRGVATTLVNVLSSVMITRLTLNLRDPRLFAVSKRSPKTAMGSYNLEVLSTLVRPWTELDGNHNSGSYGSPPRSRWSDEC